MASVDRVIVEKLNNDNYFIWKYRMQMMLAKEGCWTVIEDEKPDPETNNWKKHEQQAAGWIVQLVDNSQLVHIRKHKTAKEMWDALEAYHEKGTGAGSVQIIKEICTRRLAEDGNLEMHIHWLTDMYQKLDDLGEEKLSEKWMIGILFAQLPRIYDTVVTTLQTLDIENLRMSTVQAKLIDEYKKRIERKNNGDHAGETLLKLNTIPKVKCFFCKKTGHMKTECHKYKSWKQRKENKQKVNVVKHSDAELLFVITNKESSQINNNWIIDSGATCHITNNKGCLKGFNPENKVQIQVADGRKLISSGSGVTKIEFVNSKGESTSAKISNVHYIPEINLNVLSVRKLAEKGVITEFHERNCYLKYGETFFGIGDLLNNNQYTLRETNNIYALTSKHHNCAHYWHRACGHRDIEIVKELKNGKFVDGVKMDDCGEKVTCEICIKGKMTRLPFPKKTNSSSKAVLELVHTDVCGPMQIESPGGKRYVLTFIDDFSKYTTVYLLKYKSEVFEKYKEFIEMVKNKFSKKPIKFRSDRGGEYTSKELLNYLRIQGIHYQFTAPYTPQQNGVAERKNRTLVEMARCNLIEANLDNTFWAEAVMTANHILNRLPTKAVSKTSYELWHGCKPNISYFKPFGEKCYVHVPDVRRKKLDDKALAAILIGYDDHSKAYRCYNKESKRIIISRDVKFVIFEETQQCEMPSFDTTEERLESRNLSQEVLTSENSTPDENEHFNERIDVNNENDDAIQEEIDNNEENSTSSSGNNNPSITEHRVSTRVNKGIKSKRLIEEIDSLQMQIVETEPKTFKEAMNDKNKSKWIDAMKEEIKSLKENETWHLVELPKDKNVVGSKWIYKIKQTTDDIKIYKARLVAQGYTQIFGHDYNEVFAPVARQTTFRMLLCVASQHNMNVVHLDAKTAFLNSKIDEIIYMKQPPGFEDEVNPYFVCKLNKGIYGLKQSARLWNETLEDTLKEASFEQCNADPCLYKAEINGELCFVLVYVDDMICASRSMKVINRVEELLNSRFKVNNLGKIKNYLGLEVEKDSAGYFKISQKGCIDKITQQFDLQNAKHSLYPLRVDYEKTVSTAFLIDNENYRKAIGSLLYVATNTRPDIAASVSILAQKVERPSQYDWNEIKRLIRYLSGTKHLKLNLGYNKQEKQLVGYADANWAENRSDRKSNSGYVFRFYGSTISWCCRKQSCVSLSSTEAEFIALSEGCKELIWLHFLMADFNIITDLPTIMYEDNQGCLALITRGGYSSRSKHIDTRRCFVKDCTERGNVLCEYCPTEQMIADMLTKPLSTPKLIAFRKMCGVVE